jgi:hypothetical protein
VFVQTHTTTTPKGYVIRLGHRVCDGCGKRIPRGGVPWSPSRASRLDLCDERCYKLWQKNRRERHNRRRREQRVMQKLTTRWPERPCANCGEDFRPKRSDHVYCKTACRVAAHRVVTAKR